MAESSGSEAKAKTGLEGTGLELPRNRYGNLKSASTDQNLKEILTEIKTSKTPVSFKIITFFFFFHYAETQNFKKKVV